MFKNFIFLCSHHHFQCIFSNNEQGPVCYASKTLLAVAVHFLTVSITALSSTNAVPAILLLEPQTDENLMVQVQGYMADTATLSSQTWSHILWS